MASHNTRLQRVEAQLAPQAWLYVVMVYTPHIGVGWEAPGCESEEEALARLPHVGPQDLLLVGQAWGCDRQGTPHSHADDPIQRWPRG